jgi:hypothetical protein
VLEGLAGLRQVAAGGEARVEAPDGRPLVAQQFFAEAQDLDAQVAALHDLLGEPGVARQLRHDATPFGLRQAVALPERHQVLGRGELLHLIEGAAQVLLTVVGQFAVVEGGRRVGRQEQDVRQVVAPREPGGLEVQDRGDKQDAVEGNALLDQVAGEAGGPGGSVALPDQVQRRTPALVPPQVETDELPPPTRCRRAGSRTSCPTPPWPRGCSRSRPGR